MTRILQAGVFADHFLGGDLLFERGLLANDCRVTRFDFRQQARSEGISEMRNRLVQGARNADIVLIGKGELLDVGTLRQIQSSGCEVVLWYGDIRPQPEEWLLNLLPAVDHFFMSSGGEMLREHWRRGRPGRAHYFTHPMDPELVADFRDVPRNTRHVVFTGSRYAFAGPERRVTIDSLLKRSDATIVGSAGARGLRGLLKRAGHRFGLTEPPLLRGRDYVRMIKSARIGVGVNARNDVSKYTSDRLSHYLGFGTFFLTWRFSGIEELFTEGMELECFASPEELDLKIRQYLEDEDRREAIAKAGQQKMLDDYSCKNIVGMMLELVRSGRSARFPWIESYG